MKRFLLLTTVLLATVGAWAQGTADYEGIYTLGVDVNKQRGYVCAGEGWPDYPVLTEITLSGYTNRNVDAVENGKNWYIKASADNTGYYLYNVAVGKFLVNSGNQVNFGDTPQIWGIADNGAYKKIMKPGTTNSYLSGGCSRYANQRPMAYDGNANDGGAKYTIEAVADGTTTFAAEIAFANALIEDCEREEAALVVSYNGASSWTETSVYPEALESIPNHIGTAGHTVYKKGTMVSVKNAGDRTVTFTYTSGSCGIRILGADLVSPAGTVIASDYHAGFAGGIVQDNVYTLASVPAGTYLLRLFVCNDRDNRVNSHNGKATVASVIEPSQANKTVYFNSLKTAGTTKYANCNHATNNGKAGYYTQAALTALAEANAAAGAADAGTAGVAEVFPLAEAIEHMQVVLPAPGKFYRIKNNAGNAYLTCGTSGRAQTAADALGNKKEDVFYLTDDRQLVSYANGLYFTVVDNMLNYKADVNAGTAGFVFYASPELGKLYVEFLSANDNHRFLYSGGAGDTNAGGYNNSGSLSTFANQPGYRFSVEEVESLPVSMNAEVGYASLYSPVALDCGGFVKAYIATTVNGNNTSILLEECTEGVPANTGVILKYVENAEINSATGCLYLPVHGGEVAAAAGNALLGSLAAANISEDAYVLANGIAGVGLYKAEKTEGTWKNNAFKAYLPASALNVDGGEASSLTFSFDTETAIGGVAAAKAGKSAVYDLSGRRVKSAVKGIYIVNGKKVIK